MRFVASDSARVSCQLGWRGAAAGGAPRFVPPGKRGPPGLDQGFSIRA
jgi:hypothetical protein